MALWCRMTLTGWQQMAREAMEPKATSVALTHWKGPRGIRRHVKAEWGTECAFR